MWTPRKASPGRRFGRVARSTRAGRKPASVLPAPVGAISSTERPACGTRQEVDLMGARRPAALREPVEERSGQARRGCFGFDGPQLRHAPGVARRISAAKQNLEQKGIMPCDLKRRTLGQGREGGTKLFGGFHDPRCPTPVGRSLRRLYQPPPRARMMLGNAGSVRSAAHPSQIDAATTPWGRAERRS